MKMVMAIVSLALLAGCASKPIIIRVKNCKSVGAGLYDCEEIPVRHYDSRR